jgi:hypothetical protein
VAFDSQEAAEVFAIQRCNCIQAKMAVERARAWQDIAAEIDDLFSEDPVYTEQIQALLMNAARMVFDKEIESASYQLNYQTKVTISPAKKNKLSIKRTDTQTQKREV